MHEFSVCRVLVDTILAELAKLPSQEPRLVRARVVVGGLRQIVPEYLAQAYGMLVRDTAAAGSKLDVTSLPLNGECEACGWKGKLEKGIFLCKGCGSNRAKILDGMELYLDSLEVEEKE
jgi:hydrogenase nickel incorporation protein HypA/HybF